MSERTGDFQAKLDREVADVLKEYSAVHRARRREEMRPYLDRIYGALGVPPGSVAEPPTVIELPAEMPR